MILIVDPRLHKDYHDFLASEAKESAILEALELYQLAFGIAMHCKGCKRRFTRTLKERNNGGGLSKRLPKRGAIVA
jgi:hypothetical protein